MCILQNRQFTDQNSSKNTGKNCHNFIPTQPIYLKLARNVVQGRPFFPIWKKTEKSKIFADVSKNKQIFWFFTLFYGFLFLIKKFLCYLERISQWKYKLHVLQHFCERFQAISFTISGVIGYFITTYIWPKIAVFDQYWQVYSLFAGLDLKNSMKLQCTKHPCLVLSVNIIVFQIKN